MHKHNAPGLVFAFMVATAAVLAAPPAQAQSPRGQHHLFEAGLFFGGFFPALRHELYDPAGGTHREFERANADVGLRIAYLPVCFAGLEVEGALMPSRTSDDVSALVYSARAQAILQVPARFAPFMTLGAGIFGVSSDTLGSDIDAAFVFGAGLKAYVTRWLALRFDGRGSLGGELGSGGRTVSFELLAGASFVFGMDEAPPASSRAMAVE